MHIVRHIPVLGLGTYKLKTECEITHSMKCAIETGYRMFDTAELYKNEHHISHFIREELPKWNLSREDLWITTKVAYFTMLKGEIAIRKSIENSLKCFNGYIDLLLIHASNPNDLITWRILREYQDAGKVRNIGISNYNVERLTRFCECIGEDETRYIYVNQIEFNPYLNRAELVKMCHKRGIRVIAYGSLYKAGDEVKVISEKYGVSSEAILLKWAIQSGCIVIPMSRNEKHIRENWISIYGKEYELTSGEMDILNMLNEGYTKYQKHL